MNNKKLKISVILPVYNGQAYLDRCLMHITCQTYDNLEIIIVDDGSKDKSVSICKSYAKHDKRIKIITQPNSGPANARNNGLLSATGDYVHFHDCDDVVALDYYEKMINSANVTNADVICGEVDEIGYLFPKFEKIEIFTTLEEKIAKTKAHLFNVVWRFMYKKAFLNNHNIQYPTGMFIGEDTLFMTTCMYYAKTLATAPGAVYTCISSPTSLGKTDKKITSDWLNKAKPQIKKFEKFLKDNGIQKALDEAHKGKFVQKKAYCIFGIPLLIKKFYSNEMIKFCIIKIPFITRKVTKRQIIYYICGISVYRYYTK